MATPGVLVRRHVATRTRCSARSSASASPGLPTELLGDIAYRIPPLTDVDVTDLISSVKAAPMLHGHRGAAPVHRAALADLIARVSVLADDLPEVASLVLNPVNAHPGGVDVLGAEVVVRRAAPRRKDPGRRSPRPERQRSRRHRTAVAASATGTMGP